MAIVSGESVRVVARMVLDNQDDIINVYHYEHSGGDPVDEEDFMIGVENHLNAAYNLIAGDLTNVQTLRDIKADIVSFQGGQLVTNRSVGLVAWNGIGQPTDPAQHLPSGCAAIVNFATGVAGVIGRKYIGVPTENATNNGIVETGFQAGLTAYAVEILAGFLVDFVPFTAGVMSTKFVQFVPVTDAIIRNPIGYQRRRTPGRGA